ncbi:MAG TPA: shikimate kinase [Alphaproteobacteria bacterium]|jgi:shikimate kinase|nr:shikimate kinase [Alphaproteobacteria bacterium]
MANSRQPNGSAHPLQHGGGYGATTPRFSRSVVLVGLMGAGKSAVGRLLADRLRLPFVDADREIEAAAGLSINEIFQKHGEPFFRDREEKVMARLLAAPPQVIAAGGGAFMSASTRERIRESAISVWLKADIDLLVRRTAKRTHRPLLAGDDPRAVLERLAKVREPVYAAADITVETSDEPADNVAQRVASTLFARPQGDAAHPSQGRS